MRATKIIHRGESRIKVDFPYNQEIAALIKQIPDAKWSKTHRAWHIPYAKKEFDQLRSLFPMIEYPQKVVDVKTEELIVATPVPSIQKPPAKGVSVQVLGRHIILKLPKNTLDVHFIRSLHYSRWDSKQFCWIVPNYPGNLDLIKDFFKDRISELIIHNEVEVKTSNNDKRTIKPDELLIIKTSSRRLRLIFGFNKELTFLLKKMPFHFWDSTNKWWTIPFSERFLAEITESAKAQNLKVVYEEEVASGDDKLPRITPYDVVNYRKCPDEYMLKLKELRYSENTIKAYANLFEEFINYYNSYDIDKIDEKMIIAFMRYLVIERKLSTSYQNQFINAIHPVGFLN